MILEEQDTGRLVKVALGEEVYISLSESPTTGYRWKLESVTGFESMDDHFKPKGAIGGGGKRVFRFRAISLGLHHIRLINRREWDPEESSSSGFEAKLLVQ